MNSPRQLSYILFDKMHMPAGKKTKTGYSTAASVLDKLAETYPFVKKILEYRTLSAYIHTCLALPELIRPGKRDVSIPRLTRFVTATGRSPAQIQICRIYRYVQKRGGKSAPCLFREKDMTVLSHPIILR